MQELEEQDDLKEFDSFLNQKKKRKKLPPVISPNENENDHTYMFLLERLKEQQRQDRKIEDKSGSPFAVSGKLLLPRFVLTKYGPRKMRWNNFAASCEKMRRTQEILKKFIESETGEVCCITEQKCLILNRLLKPREFEAMISKFTSEFINCQSCKKPNTKLVRDKVTRLLFLVCDECGSRSSTPTMKTLFRAKTRSDRKKERL